MLYIGVDTVWCPLTEDSFTDGYCGLEGSSCNSTQIPSSKCPSHFAAFWDNCKGYHYRIAILMSSLDCVEDNWRWCSSSKKCIEQSEQCDSIVISDVDCTKEVGGLSKGEKIAIIASVVAAVILVIIIVIYIVKRRHSSYQPI